MIGRNPYSPEGLAANGLATYGHPPTTVLWFLPFVQLPVHELTLPLGIVTLLLLLLHTQILSRELGFPLPILSGVLAFAFMLSTAGMRSHLHAGQTSELMAFLYLLGWYLLRRRSDVAAGAVLGLACTIKLFPGLVVLFLAARRRWDAVLAAGLTYLVCAMIVTFRFGIESWVQFFELQGPIADLWMGVSLNASIHGIVLRWFAPACGRAFGAPTTAATVLALMLGAALLIGAWRVTRSLAIDYAFAFFSLLSVFVNPWVWEHYLVLYLLPFAVILAELRRLQISRLKLASIGGVMAAWSEAESQGGWQPLWRIRRVAVPAATGRRALPLG